MCYNTFRHYPLETTILIELHMLSQRLRGGMRGIRDWAIETQALYAWTLDLLGVA